MWQKAAQKCSLNGLRVLLFLLTHKKNEAEWDAIHFASWMGQSYQLGYQNWNAGVNDLAKHGLIELKDGKILVCKKGIC